MVWTSLCLRCVPELPASDPKLDSPRKADPYGGRNCTDSKRSAYLGAPKVEDLIYRRISYTSIYVEGCLLYMATTLLPKNLHIPFCSDGLEKGEYPIRLVMSVNPRRMIGRRTCFISTDGRGLSEEIFVHIGANA